MLQKDEIHIIRYVVSTPAFLQKKIHMQSKNIYAEYIFTEHPNTYAVLIIFN